MVKKSFLIQIVVLACLLEFTLPGFTQRVKFQNVTFDYQHLPLFPLDNGYKTFQSKLELVLPDDTKEIDQLVNQYIKIPGYSKTNSNPDIQIVVTFGDFKLSEKTLHTDDVYNVNAGKNLTGYLYQVKCEYPVNLIVTLKTGNEICNTEIIPDEKILSFEFGKWEYSQEALDTKYHNESEQMLLDKQNKYIKQALSMVRDTLKSYYGKIISTNRVKIAAGKGKNQNYSDLEEVILVMQKALTETVNLVIEDQNRNHGLNKAIEIRQARTGKDESSRKKEGTSPEILTMLWYNCAVAFLWQADFTQAGKALASAKQTIGDKNPKNHLRMLDDLEEEMIDLQKRVEANKTGH